MIEKSGSKDYRVTRQRRIVIEELCKVCTHPTAAEVYELVSRRDPSIGLATVYRALDFLEKNNLIIRLRSKDKEARYDGNVEKHCHLICKECGVIVDIFDVSSVEIKSNQLMKSGFEIHSDFLEIHGLCKNCKS